MRRARAQLTPRAARGDNRFGLPDAGVGVGLRPRHFHELLEAPRDADFLEVLSENFMGTGGPQMETLDRLAERYPIVLHGVCLSIGGCDPLDRGYLRELKALAERTRALWVGDHVCWTGLGGVNAHELLPLPYTEASLRHVVARVRAAQELLERPLVLENPSTYAAFRGSTLGEMEFLGRLAEEADCALLLDVNNVLVSACNHGLDPLESLAAVPWERVVQVHLAGHTDAGTHRIDTHDREVCDEVWALYARSVRLGGPRATSIEWDAHIPPLEGVLAEARKARALREREAARADLAAGAPGGGR